MKKRLPRYSLRFLLLFTAVVGCWLGFHIKWIAGRERAISWMDAQERFWDEVPLEQTAYRNDRAPLRIRMLGAEGLDRVCVIVPRQADIEPKRTELEKLFPEADIMVVTIGSGYRGKRLGYVRRERFLEAGTTKEP